MYRARLAFICAACMLSRRTLSRTTWEQHRYRSWRRPPCRLPTRSKRWTCRCPRTTISKTARLAWRMSSRCPWLRRRAAEVWASRNRNERRAFQQALCFPARGKRDRAKRPRLPMDTPSSPLLLPLSTAYKCHHLVSFM
jgi:hypothetical protein